MELTTTGERFTGSDEVRGQVPQDSILKNPLNTRVSECLVDFLHGEITLRLIGGHTFSHNEYFFDNFLMAT